MTDRNIPTELVMKLLGFSSAYPEEMFPPLTKAEIAELPSGILDRASAAMGRHVAKFAKEAATELERLEFIQRDFHNVDDVAEIRDLRVRLREALDIVRLNATTEQVAWMREVESELADDVPAPTPPDVLVGALQDVVHKEKGHVRAARSLRFNHGPNCASLSRDKYDAPYPCNCGAPQQGTRT